MNGELSLLDQMLVPLGLNAFERADIAFEVFKGTAVAHEFKVPCPVFAVLMLEEEMRQTPPMQIVAIKLFIYSSAMT